MTPVLSLSICFILGIATGAVFPSSWIAGIGASAACALLIGFSIRRSAIQSPSLLLAAFVLGWIRLPDTPLCLQNSQAPCDRVIEGVIAEPPVQVDDGFRAVIEIRRRSACLDGPSTERMSIYRGALVVTVRKGPWNAARGQGVLLRAAPILLLPNRNPGAALPSSDLPSFATTLDDISEIATTSYIAPNIRNYFDRRRSALSEFFGSVLQDSTGAAAKALVLGETASLPFDIKEDYRRTGCYHLLSVSGLHLALAAAFAFFIFRFVLVRTRLAAKMDVARIAAAASIVPTVGFTLLTGASTPVVRACVMATSALLARILKRPQGGVESLALAAALILIVRPQDLFDPGFQLSFTAVIGFFIVFTRVENGEARAESRFGRIAKLRRGAARLLISTIAAGAVTSPIVLYHFGYVSWISPLANLIAIPLAEFLIMPLLFIAVVVEPLSHTVSAAVLKPAWFLIRLLDGFLSAVSDLPCTIESPTIPAAIGIVVFCAALLLFAARVRKAGIFALVCFVVTAITLLLESPKFAPGFLTVHFFDVGQGDAALLTSPKGAHMLVDGGPLSRSGFDAGERLVVPALRALGVSSVDTVLSTHPDSDHIGGLPAVLRAFEVGRLFENGQEGSENSRDLYRSLREVADRRGVSISSAPSICGIHEFGGATVEVIHPCDRTLVSGDSSNTNDSSLVLFVKFRQVSLLMLGDVSEDVEGKLSAAGRLPKADIVKIAHHGSKTSTSYGLLDAVKPTFAVVSVGRYNRFGFPHRAVLERLTEKGIRIIRTDVLGAVVFRTDGRTIEIVPTTTNSERDD